MILTDGDRSTNANDFVFRWQHAIATGRKIFQQDFPPSVTVYLIEAENLGLGLDLSPSVQRAADLVFAEIIQAWEPHPHCEAIA